ncbi:MAG: ATP-binding protein [Actinomycetota bacterium]
MATAVQLAGDPARIVETPTRGDARAVRLLHGADAVPDARRAFRSDVADQLPDDETVSEACLVVSELLGNAVTHARALPDGRVLMRWQVRGPVVDVEVTDGGGAGEVRPARASVMSVHGRGLRIVRSLAHEWGVHEGDNGHRTVWASLGGPSRRRRVT